MAMFFSNVTQSYTFFQVVLRHIKLRQIGLKAEILLKT